MNLKSNQMKKKKNMNKFQNKKWLNSTDINNSNKKSCTKK